MGALRRHHPLFVNTHPAELVQGNLIASLQEIRELHPDRKITLEIHEGAVTTPNQIKDLRVVLTDLDMGLAFGDFGAGT